MTEETPQEPVRKKSPVKAVLIGVAAVVLCAGAFFGYTLYAKRVPEAPVARGAEAVRIVYPLKSFIVNLVERNGVGRQYLKMTMELEVGSEADRKILESRLSPIRDTVLLLLSSLSFPEINSMEGKVQLKHALLTRINEVLGGDSVVNIYFTEFVVQ